MNKLFLATSVAAVCSMPGSLSPVFAGDNKAELVQIIRQEKSTLDSLVADKAMTFNLSPEWWQCFLNRDTRAYEEVNILAIDMMRYAHNAGLDDIEALDQAQDASSPLVIEEINKLPEKVHCTIEISGTVPEDKKAWMLQNLKTMGWSIREKTICKPRVHRLNLIYTITPKAQALSCTISPDGNTYHFLVPSSIHVEAGEVDKIFRKAI